MGFSSQSNPCIPPTQSCAERHSTRGVSLPLGRKPGKSLAVKAPGGPPTSLASTKLVLRSGDAPDPEDFMKHMSDVCNTLGAFLAFCGPDGEIVGALFGSGKSGSLTQTRESRQVQEHEGGAR